MIAAIASPGHRNRVRILWAESTMNLLAISGSLRAASSNTAFLHTIQRAVCAPVEMHLFNALGSLPPFNPDLDEAAPDSVTSFRAMVADADAVVISTPEYAHGIPGVLKNALDWLVGSGELYRKPVVLLHLSARGEYGLSFATRDSSHHGSRDCPRCGRANPTFQYGDSFRRSRAGPRHRRCGEDYGPPYRGTAEPALVHAAERRAENSGANASRYIHARMTSSTTTTSATGRPAGARKV